MINIFDYLKSNSYPGRGIAIGCSNNNAYIAYFIMGRSENSRNRVFEQTEDGICTKAFEADKLKDPSLVIYNPVRVLGENTIVTNGDQTDTIRNYILKGDTFENALRSRCYEPDAPNFTPRISGILNGQKYKLSILKKCESENEYCHRQFFEYTLQNGIGHFIHTYKGDGNPIPSFEGEPKAFELACSLQEFSDKLWDSLNEQNKVSLFVRAINLKTKQTATIITNKNI